MGGGNTKHCAPLRCGEGLSPRGRGKPADTPSAGISHRSIPAWAGETFGFAIWAYRHAVYPRVGGGNCGRALGGECGDGLSPRGRGKHSNFARCGQVDRSIPAWAGETRPPARSYGGRRVYPRVGGGNQVNPTYGSGGGGLSPRGRGKPSNAPDSRPSMRSIPAWAGETTALAVSTNEPQVYPRVGGGNAVGRCNLPRALGLSPRGRGKRSPGTAPLFESRSIPAWAGETLSSTTQTAFSAVYPRVGGGNLITPTPLALTCGLSPRGRGKPQSHIPDFVRQRSIPAWAGETPYLPLSHTALEVYPRVGGGNCSSSCCPTRVTGLSPRGRGKLALALAADDADRSIPAWAGETWRRGRWR